jgi:PhzF family phenazine biosynthesis protein
MASPQVHLINVFASGPNGGNPAPIVIDALGMSDEDMQAVARASGHESGFVLPAPPDSDCDFAIRFWVPNHEMEMCGHATVGAVWLLHRLGRLTQDRAAIWTRSGRVETRMVDRGSSDSHVEITQPRGHVEALPEAKAAEAEILSVLGIRSSDLAPLPIQNARTSRTKTLVPLKSVAVLDGLTPDFRRIEEVCGRIGSTGLYPYAVSDLHGQAFDARQFPKSSGYPEDAATGIAAAALAFGLVANKLVDVSDRPIRIRQGRAMGRPSEIAVRLRIDDHGDICGCWLGGSARLDQVSGQ